MADTADSGDFTFDVEAEEFGKELCQNFSGWVFPHGGKSLIGSNMRVIIRKQYNVKNDNEVKDSPHEQIKKAIETSRAARTGPNDDSGLSMLYKGLREIKSDFALVEPLFISVSGSSFQPAAYFLEGYTCPTERFAGFMSECETLVKDKAYYMNEDEKKKRRIQNFNLLKYASRSKQNGVAVANLLQSHSVVHLSSADAGLKFKDRQAAKLSVDKRERTILSIVENILSI